MADRLLVTYPPSVPPPGPHGARRQTGPHRCWGTGFAAQEGEVAAGSYGRTGRLVWTRPQAGTELRLTTLAQEALCPPDPTLGSLARGPLLSQPLEAPEVKAVLALGLDWEPLPRRPHGSTSWVLRRDGQKGAASPVCSLSRSQRCTAVLGPRQVAHGSSTGVGRALADAPCGRGHKAKEDGRVVCTPAQEGSTGCLHPRRAWK